MSNVDATSGVKYDTVETYKVADSQTIEEMDPLYISSGKVAQYNSAGIVPSTVIGFASEAKTVTTLASEGQQKYIGVRRKGVMSFTGLIDTGSYTSSISVGDKVSLYCDGSGSYYVVNDNTNPIGEVVEGSMDTAGSSTTILVATDLTTENVQAGEIGFPLTIPTDSKIQFRDSGIYMHSNADGKLTISSDGSGADDIIFSGNVTMNNDLVVDGSFSGVSEGKTFTGTVQINDNYNLQFEGTSGDSDGFTINCDSSGDTKLDSTAGALELNCKDAVFTFQDSDDSNSSDYLTITVADAGSVAIFKAEPSGIFRFQDAGDDNDSDYLQFTITDTGGRQVIAAEPSGAFRFKDAGDGNNSDVLDLDVVDAGSAATLTAANGFEVATTTGNITLDSAGDIAFEAAGGDVTMDAQLTITSTSADLLVLKYDGSNDCTVDVDSDGSTTITTTGTDADFEIATGTGGDITLDATSALVFEPGTTATFTLAEAGYISIDAGTNDTAAANVLLMNVDVKSTDCNAIGLDVDVGTALSAGEIVNGISVDIDGDAGDNASAELRGIYLTSANTTSGVNEGISFAGTWDTGIEMNFTAVTTGINLLINAADNNAMKGIVISKDMAVVTAVGTSTMSNSALDISQAASSATSADDALTVSNNMVSFASTNTTSLATADVYSGTVLALAYTASTTGAGTATSTGKALSVDYNVTETAGTLTVDDTNVVDIDVDFDGTVSVANNGDFNILNINVEDDETIVWGTTSTCSGINLDMSGLVVSDSDLTLTGVKIAMPATYGAATEYALYASGDGTTVALCSDAATAITIGGTVTTGLSIGGTLTTAMSVGACSDVIVMGGDVSGSFLDMDACTGGNGEMVSTSGTAATTFAARVKVQTPDGNPGYINVYSTSNEA